MTSDGAASAPGASARSWCGGHRVNAKHVYRLYREMGLAVRRNAPRGAGEPSAADSACRGQGAMVARFHEGDTHHQSMRPAPAHVLDTTAPSAPAGPSTCGSTRTTSSLPSSGPSKPVENAVVESFTGHEGSRYPWYEPEEQVTMILATTVVARRHALDTGPEFREDRWGAVRDEGRRVKGLSYSFASSHSLGFRSRTFR